MIIEICYATSTQQQTLIELEVSRPCSIKLAIEQSGFLKKFPEINLAVYKVGIWSKKQSLDTLLQPKDRIEIYRPLLLSPTEARKLRAERANLKQVPK